MNILDFDTSIVLFTLIIDAVFMLILYGANPSFPNLEFLPFKRLLKFIVLLFAILLICMNMYCIVRLCICAFECIKEFIDITMNQVSLIFYIY